VIDVTCRATDDDSWSCRATIGGEGERTRHTVTVRRADLERLDPGRREPERLVRATIAFLLEREPASQILSSFDLPVVSRYYPEYEAIVGRGRRRPAE
jgi:hypothetical protein